MNPKQLKIALVSDSVLPFHKGGKEMRIQHLVRELKRMGQDVHIYTMRWWDDGAETYEHEGVTYHALCKLYPLYKGKRRSMKEGILFGLACLRLRHYDFDVLEVDHMPYFPIFFSKIVAVLKRKPLYATWHEVVGPKAWHAYIGGVNGAIAWWIEKMSVRLPDHIIAVSGHTQQLLREVLHYRGPLTLVSNGIDYQHIASIAPATVHSDVLYAGRMIPHKNVDLLIQAIALLVPERPTIRCTIIGGGPQLEKLRALARELGVERNVTFTGRLETSDEVYARMKTARVFASPSIREGFGITILEAYACGLSVVTVKHPDNAGQYLVQPGAGLVCEPTAEAIAVSIKQLLDKPVHVRRVVDAEAYDWTNQATKLREVYSV